MPYHLTPSEIVESPGWHGSALVGAPTRYWLELDRRGLFLRLGQIEAYLCGEADGAWVFRREPDGFDVRIWRLHLTIGAVPR